MNKTTFQFLSAIAVGMTATSLLMAAEQKAAEPIEDSDFGRWYISPGIGLLNFEGDEGLEDGAYFTLRLGYDYSEWWSFEASLLIAPKLDENLGGYTQKVNGEWVRNDERLSYSKGDTHFGDTWGLQLYGDAMFHFSSFDRIDPYLIAGVGVSTYGKQVMDSDFCLALRAGGGIMYHLNDSWTLRLDTRIDLAGYNTEFNQTIDVGFIYRFSADLIDDDPTAIPPLDSDGDGLTDDDEINRYKTDPQNPDTDGDGLKDGEEVLYFKTDPLNPDTDGDGLKDGEEVKTYKTDPNNPDTDKGGVRDGHEVLIDKTDPLNGADDRLFFELKINFDTDSDVIKPEFFEQLDKVVAVLRDAPNATAVIEGHADQRSTSKRNYNIELSSRRAAAVLKYIAEKGIDASRLKSIGYGFEHPKASNDPSKGNVENRRVEVYINGTRPGKVTYVQPEK